MLMTVVKKATASLQVSEVIARVRVLGIGRQLTILVPLPE
jgi:hypothetical protein